MKLLQWITVFLLLTCTGYSQPVSNFSLIEGLAVQAVTSIPTPPTDAVLPGDFAQEGSFSIFESSLLAAMTAKGKAVQQVSGTDAKLRFRILEAGIRYSEPYRESFFGGYRVPRTATLSYSYTLRRDGLTDESKTGELQVTDTLDYSEVPSVEDGVYSFTAATVPNQPGFSSLFEPIVVTAAAAAAVILFFTVRNK